VNGKYSIRTAGRCLHHSLRASLIILTPHRMVSIYSPALQAFLKTDLSFDILDGPFNELIDHIPLDCSWLMLPVPLHCRPGNVEASFSATKLVCIGRESFVFACAPDCMHELSVIKSLIRPDAARRIEDLLYEANLPNIPDFSDVLCPVLFNSYSTMPAMFLTQRRCGRSLVEICRQFTESSMLASMPFDFDMAIRITHRICKITQCIHNLGFLILNIAPSNFCEGTPGDPLTLLITDFREVRRFQRMTYSTPNYMKTVTGGRLGLPTGDWKMMPFSSAFLDNLECNSYFASNEILKLPGSIDLSADVFSIACILVWMVMGIAPCNIANNSKAGVGESTPQARNEVLQNLKTVFEPQIVKGVMTPNDSLGSRAIASAMKTPQLAEIVMSALSDNPDTRPALSALTAAFEQYLNVPSYFIESE
jgi:serine/threonine protein kinase